jgi:hypothetical protein
LRTFASKQHPARTHADACDASRSAPTATRPATTTAAFTFGDIPVHSADPTGRGRCLQPEVRGPLEASFGESFADVRVHEDDLAESHGALAVTSGSDVHFRTGALRPETKAGMALLAHELTHVVQQRRVGRDHDRSAGPAGAPTLADDALEREADTIGARAIAGSSVAGMIAARVGVPRVQLKTTAAWANGPTTTRKSKGHSLAEYVAWVKEVETKYGGNEDVTQRLRRLYYSDFTGGAGPKFDEVITTRHQSHAPLTSPPLAQTTLDGLYETDFITTPAGEQVDVSHLFAALDVDVAGEGMQAAAGGLKYGVDMRGVLTWVGDLASWFVEWQSELKKTESTGKQTVSAVTLLRSLASKKVSKDDLLGNMGGQVAAATHGKATILPSYHPRIAPAIIKNLTAKVSDILQMQYGGSGRQLPAPLPNRFDAFVVAARPTIPWDHAGSVPGKVKLASNAKTAIHDTVSNTASLFLAKGYSKYNPYAGDPTAVKTYDVTIWVIAIYFANFLTTGLEKGDAPWPPP